MLALPLCATMAYAVAVCIRTAGTVVVQSICQEDGVAVERILNLPFGICTYAIWVVLKVYVACVCLQGNAKALATVTAIIDGMGSIGAALGPMLTGYISERGGFDMVFTMLYSAAVIAGLLLIRLAGRELAVMRARAKGVA